jgi:hypothetical protein
MLNEKVPNIGASMTYASHNVRSARNRESFSERCHGILRRSLNRISAWDRSQKDPEIGRLIASSGGRLTDDLERRIMERAMTVNFSDS